MKTAFILLAQYDGRAVIPVEIVCRDYFTHLNATGLVGKIHHRRYTEPYVTVLYGFSFHIKDLILP